MLQSDRRISLKFRMVLAMAGCRVSVSPPVANIHNEKDILKNVA